MTVISMSLSSVSQLDRLMQQKTCKADIASHKSNYGQDDQNGFDLLIKETAAFWSMQ